MIIFEPRKWSVEQRILAVVAYFDVFDLALSIEEISDLILGEKTTVNEISLVLNELSEQLDTDGYLYVLRGREVLFETRSKQRICSTVLMKKVYKYTWIWRFVPYVTGVAVCNYLPLGVAGSDSDIDLFVITKPGRIFLSRFVLTVVTHFCGLRRHGRKIGSRFCLSFYASESSLNFNSILEAPYDVYFLYWLRALTPLYGDSSLWSLLENSNTWTIDFMDWEIRKNTASAGKNWLVGKIEYILSGSVGNVFENILNKFFARKHQRRINSLPAKASVIISENMLKYHNNDRRSFFRNEFEKRLNNLGFSS